MHVRNAMMKLLEKVKAFLKKAEADPPNKIGR